MGANSNEGARHYTVSGLEASQYDIALFPTDNVMVDGDGNATFVDADGDNAADGDGPCPALSSRWSRRR
jgi:hypothetical protein